MHLRSLATATMLFAALDAAQGADLLNSSKEPVSGAVSAINWNGLYVSAGVGAAFADSRASAPGGALDVALSGARFDGRVGFDRTLAPGWLLGIYGEIGHNRDVTGAVGGADFGQKWTYGGGLRAGLEIGNAMPYALVGYSHQDISFSGPSAGLDGIKLGGGIEVKLDAHWFAALEGSWTGYQDAKNIGIGLGAPATFADREIQVGARLGWKL